MTLSRGAPSAFDNDGGSEFTERVIHIRRVAKVVKGGRHLTFNAMVVVGDNHGRVGIGLGKGSVVPDAVRKANTIARRDLVLVPLKGSTIPHAVRAHYGASRVIIKPAPAGAGIVAGGALRAVMEAVGVRDVVAKALGSRNPINLVKATLEGLKLLQGEPGAEQFEIRSAPRSEPVQNDNIGKPIVDDRLPVDSKPSDSADEGSEEVSVDTAAAVDADEGSEEVSVDTATAVDADEGSEEVSVDTATAVENTTEINEIQDAQETDDDPEESKES